MGYRVREVNGFAGENRPLAEFLASFVQDGELNSPRKGDDDADVWQRRMFWWWDENPFCTSDSPRGYILQQEDGEIVGFNGMIPFDYVVNGETLLTLITTTFFVRESHRSAVLGLLTRQRSLSRTYQIIDGSPSPEVRQLLTRQGYQHSGFRAQYFFPLKKLGGGLSQVLLKSFGFSFLLTKFHSLTNGYLANSPEEVEKIPSVSDSRIQRKVTRESLSWLCGVGTEDRQFFGLCDDRGELIAYAIGIYNKHWKIQSCMLVDYYDFRPQEDGMMQLLKKILSDPLASGVDPATDLITWSILNEKNRPSAAGMQRESILHYHLPPSRAHCEKRCLPIEGDLAFL